LNKTGTRGGGVNEVGRKPEMGNEAQKNHCGRRAGPSSRKEKTGKYHSKRVSQEKRIVLGANDIQKDSLQNGEKVI